MEKEAKKTGEKFSMLVPAAEPLMVQRKVAVGAIDDPLEHEADAVADRVMRMPKRGMVQRKCAHCEEEEKSLQRKPLASYIQKKMAEGGVEAGVQVSDQINASRGSGSPLPGTTKSFMESRFGADFSDVRIHSDTQAAAMSHALHAHAFAYGNDIYFNSGKFSPETEGGKRLLAHELTHTLQQSKKPTVNSIQRSENITLGDDYTASTEDSYFVFGGTSSGSSSGIFPPSSQTVNLNAGDSGSIDLVCFSRTDQSNWTFDGLGSALFIAKVLYEVSETGMLSFVNLETTNRSNSGFRLPSPLIEINANIIRSGQSGVITITHLFGDATSMTTGMNGSIGVPPLTVGGNMSGSITSQANSFKQYNLYVHINPIEPISYSPDISFGVDSDRVLEGEEVRLSNWFLELPSSLQRQIREGKRQILITGLASTTGNVAHNRDLSLRRAQRVERILSSLAGEHAGIETRGMGEIPTRRVSADGMESPVYRIARISILPPVIH